MKSSKIVDILMKPFLRFVRDRFNPFDEFPLVKDPRKKCKIPSYNILLALFVMCVLGSPSIHDFFWKGNIGIDGGLVLQHLLLGAVPSETAVYRFL